VILVCELSKEKPLAKWEIEDDDGDEDFLCHTLFLKQVNYTFFAIYRPHKLCCNIGGAQIKLQ